MISARPNLAYLKAAWAAHAGISAENCRQSYEEAGISFERVNHSWVVRKNQTLVSTMPLRYTRHELRTGFLGRIEMEARKAAAEVEAMLLRDLMLPDDHAMVAELEQSMRNLRRRASRAFTILIGPTQHADTTTPIYIEMQIFLDAPRACLFAHRLDTPGPAGTDLLADAPKRQRHPRAETYAELAQNMAATINGVFDELL